MSKELVISSNRHETKVAVLEDDQLVEIFFQRANEYSLAGSIHKGRVTRVLPGMQSAFVDLGLERDCFLYVSDFFEENDDLDSVEEAKPQQERSATASAAGGERERGGDRDRGGFRGGRDRGRGRDRDRGPRTGAPVVAAADSSAEPQLREAEPIDAEATVAAVAGETPAVVAGEAKPQDDRNNQAGRRRRRGRRGRNGFPDSKYASANDIAAGPDEEPVEVEGAAEPEIEEVAAPVVVVAAPAEEVFLLPGESLRKYRNPAPEPAAPPVRVAPVRVAAVPPPLPTSVAVPEPVPVEVIAAPVAEIRLVETLPVVELRADEVVAVPARELTHPEIQVIEDNRVEAAEEAAYAALEEMAAEGSHEALSVVEVLESADDTYSEAEAEEEAIAEAHVLDATEEDEADDVEDSADEAGDVPEGEQVAGEEGPEPARIPQSLTATLRDRDRNARFQQSRGRRGRRGRSRGGRPEPQAQAAGAGAGAAEAPVEAVAEQQVERTDRPERSGDRPERERSERPERSGDRPERTGDRPERGGGERRFVKPALPSITDLLKPGQEILVQVAKEPIAQKGARITSHIALPGRYCVYMPTVEHMGVSRKIASDEERLRLKRILQQHRQGLTGGFIIRTAGEGKTEEDIAADMKFLFNLWVDIRNKAERKPAPVLMHHDLDIVQRILRDQLTTTFKNIWLDNEELYESTVHFVERFQPAMVNRVRLYTRPQPIFDSFGVTAELEKALRPKVWLKSGGYIVINQTEALVAIDIKTGKFVGKSNRLEDTIVKTNTEAVKEIVRQMRLRDLGGIIVVDFIDMDERKNRAKVMQALEDAMRSDRAPYKILQFNDFGLVAITRKRVKQSLERTLCAPCPYCEGAAYVKSVQTVIGEILTEAQKMAKVFDGKDVMLRVNPEVAKVFKSHETHYLEELEGILGKTVMVKGDPTVHQEKFDMAS